MLSDVLDFRAQTDPEDQLDDVPNLLDWSTPSPADLRIDTSPEEQVSIGEPGPSRPRERTLPLLLEGFRRQTRFGRGGEHVKKKQLQSRHLNRNRLGRRRIHQAQLGRGRRKKAIPQRYLPTPSPMPAKRGRPLEVHSRPPQMTTSGQPASGPNQFPCLEEDRVAQGKFRCIRSHEPKRPLNLSSGEDQDDHRNRRRPNNKALWRRNQRHAERRPTATC